MGMPQITPGRYKVWECVSALQKAIRRGQEVEALHWFYELEAAKLYALAANRVRICSQEDIGLADHNAVIFVHITLTDAERLYKGKNPAWRICIGNAIRTLCRARKSREGDHFQAAVQYRRAHSARINVPDHAKDHHTAAGRKLGRGLAFFRTEGAQLHPLASPDPYEADAYKQWAEEQDCRANQGKEQNLFPPA